MPEHSRLQLISMSAIALCSEKNTAVSSLKCVVVYLLSAQDRILFPAKKHL